MTDNRDHRNTYHYRPLSCHSSRLHLDRICIFIGRGGIDAIMGEIQRYLGPKTNPVIGQLGLFCGIAHCSAE